MNKAILLEEGFTQSQKHFMKTALVNFNSK